MNRWTKRQSAAALLAAFLTASFLLGGGVTCGQQEKTAVEEPAVKKTAKKPRGRLPSYFARVVNEKQREEIYRIQGVYAEQLEKLRRQIEESQMRLQQEVDAVLTEEQLAQVKKMRDEAKAKRAAKTRTAKASDPADESDR